MKRAFRIVGITFGLACAGVAVVAASVLRQLPLTPAQRARAGREWPPIAAEMRRRSDAWCERCDPAGVQP